MNTNDTGSPPARGRRGDWRHGQRTAGLAVPCPWWRL